ncbi:MAG: KH domain-containing protein, partial [Verrucomicrobiia bacterium]
MPVDARALTEEFVKLLGFEATVTEQHIQDGVLIDIQCDDPGRLIGRQGQTLSQLQYLINRMIYQ